MTVSQSYIDIKQEIFGRTCDRLVKFPCADDEQVIRMIRECIIADRNCALLSKRERTQICHEVFNRIRKLDVLQDLIDDDSVTEIMVNGTDEIFIERAGRLVGSGVRFESKERLVDIISKVAADVNRTVNLSSPILDARLLDGSRVNVVLDPVAINGPTLTIRRFPDKPVDAAMLVAMNSVTEPVIGFLQHLVMAGYNILISGSTGSGKTTLLNVLSGFIPKDERIITIEDSAELRIMGIRNLVRLEARSATNGGCNEVSIRDLIKTSLRMRPDRIVVGEVRGEEAIDMLQAFNVGQDGSLSTLHANSATDALSRLETMIMLGASIPVEVVRRQISSGVDIIIHLGRLRDKSRHVLEIAEVVKTAGPSVNTRTLFRFTEEGFEKDRVLGTLEKINDLENTEKMIRAGICISNYREKS